MADMDANSDEPLILAIVGGLWATIPVTEQPELTLVQWGVRQLPDGSRSLVGWCDENSEGRVSSAILQFDPSSLRGRTASGRVYQLQGPPGHDPDAEYVWARWLRINGYSDWVDVTAEVVKS